MVVSAPQPCPVCGSSHATSLLTYKHEWRFCGCGNAHRHRRPRFPAERLPSLLQRVIPGRARELLLVRPAVQEGGDVEMYTYYREIAALGSARGTKWEGQLAALRAHLSRLGVELAGKAVLDLSGGPGFLVQELRDVAARAVVTEFHPAAVQAMRELLGVEATCFDFNRDRLSALFGAPFDVVLIRYAINFCLDLPRLAGELRAISRPGAVVYVSYVPPTLGCCLRWQWDDYTYLALYTPETMARAFSGAGFTEVDRGDEGEYHYTSGWRLSSKGDLLKRAMAAWYRSRAWAAPERSTVQRNLVQVFRAS